MRVREVERENERKKSPLYDYRPNNSRSSCAFLKPYKYEIDI